jgi:hypothetical protein
MKKSIIVLLTTLLINTIEVNAQVNRVYQRATVATDTGRQQFLSRLYLQNKNKVLTVATFVNANVINSVTRNGMTVQVGANLQGSPDRYKNNGVVRNVETGSINCTYQPKQMDYLIPGEFSVANFSNFSYYPGDFISPSSIISNIGALSPYTSTHARNPYKIGISIFSNTGTNEITVNNFTTSPQAKIQDSLLISNFGAGIPTNGVIEAMEIKSTFQLAANLETSSGVFLPLEEFGIPADIMAGLRGEAGGETDIKLRYFAVNFFQPLYTLNLLTNHTSLFANPQHVTQNSNGAYVSDVTYGRRAMFIFAAVNFNAVLNAFFEQGTQIAITGGEAAGVEGGVKVAGEINTQTRNEVKKFWGKIYGGSSNEPFTTYNSIDAFHAAFKDYITARSARIFSATTGALPLFYSLRRISDGAVIGVKSLGPFDEKISCGKNNYTVDIDFKRFQVNKVIEGPGDNMEDIWGDFSYISRNTNTRTINANNGNLMNIASGNAISRKTGQYYEAASNPKRIINEITKSDLLHTVLNFKEAVYDWELLIKPDYNPRQGVELQFNFANVESEINALAAGQSKTILKRVVLYENADVNSSKITLDVNIKITRE